MSDIEYEDAPEFEQEEVIEEKPAKEYKRKPTLKQLETMRANLEKGRAKKAQLTKARKEDDQQYDQYLIDGQAPKKRGRQPAPKYDDEDDYTDDYTDEESEPEYEIRPKKKEPNGKKGEKKSARDKKHEDKLDKIESILMQLAKEQKRSRNRPKVVKNIAVNVPSNRQAQPAPTNLTRLLKLF
jgi:hypothetical protein